MTIPKYVQRIARLPEVFEILAAHPGGMRVADLAEEIGVRPGDLHDDLLAFYTADVGPLFLGLSRPAGLEFLGPDGEVEPQEAEVVRVIDDHPGEEIGVEHIDAAELALVYTAARALHELEPGDVDLAAAIDVLTDAIFGEEKPPSEAPRRVGPVGRLRAAIADRRRVRITYSRSWYQGVVERVIDPYRLMQTRRGWEVDAGPLDDHGALRTYLVDNLRAIEVVAETYQNPAGLPALLAQQRKTARVRVRIPHAARWAADSQAETVTVADEGEVTVTLDLDLLPPVRHRLGLLMLAAGLDAQVIDPPHLIQTGPALAATLLEHHRG